MRDDKEVAQNNARSYHDLLYAQMQGGAKRIFQPKRTDDLAERCKPWIGKEVTVQSWHSNVSMRDKYPDDECVGFVFEFWADVPESELI